MIPRYGKDLKAKVMYLNRFVVVIVKSDEATKRVTMPGSQKKDMEKTGPSPININVVKEHE